MEATEKLMIDIKALIEEIRQYEYINITYYTELEKSLSPFLLDRAIFCLKNIASWFENHIDNPTNNADYKKLWKFFWLLKIYKMNNIKYNANLNH